ncbi:unnamed protein product [Closterium sp. Yama58-4]|nr:unnamed protein product [Closterium sp. Yama58-4]
MRRRRRRHLRRMAREANAELARSVAEWRTQSFRHPDSQAVVVLAAETERSRGWSAEDHRRSFSCGDLGECGPPDTSHGGCSGRIVPNGRENSSGETGEKRDGAPPRRSEQASCSSSGASGVTPGASAGAAGGSAGAPARASSSGASCRPVHRRGMSVNALPELCPFPPVDWRWVPSPDPAAASHCAAAAASHCAAAAASPYAAAATPHCPAAATRYPAAPGSFCTAPPSGATSPALSPLSPSSLVSSPSQLLSRYFASSPDSSHTHRAQVFNRGTPLGKFSDTSAAVYRSFTADSAAGCVLNNCANGTSSVTAVKTPTDTNQRALTAARAAAAVASAAEGSVQTLSSIVHTTGEARRGAGGQEAGIVEKKKRSGALHGAKARWFPPVSAALHKFFSRGHCH